MQNSVKKSLFFGFGWEIEITFYFHCLESNDILNDKLFLFYIFYFSRCFVSGTRESKFNVESALL